MVKFPKLLTISFNRFLVKFLNKGETKTEIINKFHKIFYSAPNTWRETYWLGNLLYKCPLDLWIYQEIIFSQKPDKIIETGTFQGGNALFLANICDLIDHGKVITIDIEELDNRPKHNRIIYLNGSSTSIKIKDYLSKIITEKDKVMVILDSDHSKTHVLNELKVYSKYVSKGCYLIVDDSNINGHPILPNFGPGPMEAIEEFLKMNKDFIIDKSKERYLMTLNPNGYLKKIV